MEIIWQSHGLNFECCRDGNEDNHLNFTRNWYHVVISIEFTWTFHKNYIAFPWHLCRISWNSYTKFLIKLVINFLSTTVDFSPWITYKITFCNKISTEVSRRSAHHIFLWNFSIMILQAFHALSPVLWCYLKQQIKYLVWNKYLLNPITRNECQNHFLPNYDYHICELKAEILSITYSLRNKPAPDNNLLRSWYIVHGI